MSWLTDTAIATGLLIVAVLVLRRPVARLFGPGLAYALWVLPMLRLALPPLVLPARAGPAEDMVTVVTVSADAAPLAVPTAALSDLAPLAQAVWLGGAVLFLAWRTWSYRAMRQRLLAGARPVGEVAGVRLVESQAVGSPIAFGLRDKVVALPLGYIDSEDREGRDLAIAHELEHHRGRDLAANLAMQPLLALHWLNPLAWIGWKAMRRDQEAACDARVLAGRGAAERERYARLIAEFAAARTITPAAPMACPVIGEKSIVYRLRSLTMPEPTPRSQRIGRLLLAGAVLALPLTATISRAEPETPVAAQPVAAPAPDGAHKLRRVVIVESDNPDDPSLSTSVVKRGDSTYEFRTRKPLSEAEANARADALEQNAEVSGSAITVSDEGPKDGSPHMRKVIVVTQGAIDPVPPVPPVPPQPGAAAQPAAGPHPVEVRRVVVRTNGQGGTVDMVGPGGSADLANCGPGKPIEARSEQAGDGKRQVSHVVICSKGDASSAQRLAALRKARAEIAADTHIAPGIKQDLLRQLDAEIASLEKQV